MIIRKVNVLAGAGKTFAAVHYADRNARIGHKYALVQPTQDLIDETVKEIRKLKPTYSVTAIHGGTSDNVIRDIVDHTRTARSHEGDILLMTHADFSGCPTGITRTNGTSSSMRSSRPIGPSISICRPPTDC